MPRPINLNAGSGRYFVPIVVDADRVVSVDGVERDDVRLLIDTGQEIRVFQSRDQVLERLGWVIA